MDVVVEKNQEIHARNERIRILETLLRQATQQHFGEKTETLAGMQCLLFDEDVDAGIAALSARIDKLLPQGEGEEKKATQPVRKSLSSDLSHVDKVIPPAETRCPECDETLIFIRDAVSEKLEYIPAQVVVNRYIRP